MRPFILKGRESIKGLMLLHMRVHLGYLLGWLFLIHVEAGQWHFGHSISSAATHLGEVGLPGPTAVAVWIAYVSLGLVGNDLEGDGWG